MSVPIGAGVRAVGWKQSMLGEVVRGPRRASRGMLWVQWEGMANPVLWHRCCLVYVSRRYREALAWRAAEAAGEVHSIR
jgi:hypothetical protein